MNQPLNQFRRGIFAHVLTWFFLCLLIPFIYSGFTRQSVSDLGFALPIFLVGIIPLLIGSVVWMLPFLSRWFSDHFSLIYHLWVAIGASLALLIYVDMQFAGDPPPPAHYYIAPAVSAFIIALVISLLHNRHSNVRTA